MARIRSAKPEFWTDPLMTGLSRDIRFTFKGLFEVCADDFGFFLGDVRLVKSQIWPLDDDLTLRKIEGFLLKLHELGRIKLYEVGGVRYGQILNWHKHQRVDHPTPSRIPRENVANGSREVREEFASVSRPRARRGDRIGRERIGKEAEAVVKECARDEPGSAAAVATLPTSELPELPELIGSPDGPGPTGATYDGISVPRFETPAQSPNGIQALPAEFDRTVPQVLPHAAVKFGRTFYPRGVATDARRSDVFAQLLAVLKPEGLAFNGGVIRVTPARLSSACLAVLKTHEKQPLEDPDAAIAYLLVKLSDVSQDSPTEAAQTEAKRVEVSDQLTFAERKAIADKIAAEHPEEAAQIELDAVKVFPGKVKEMQQPRESYRISRLLKLAEGTNA